MQLSTILVTSTVSSAIPVSDRLKSTLGLLGCHLHSSEITLGLATAYQSLYNNTTDYMME